MTERHFQFYCLVFSGAAIGAFLYLILSLCDGRLIYTLDDPYIHLAVSENILKGGYGVNAEEFSSPSSSIIFPLLLTLPVALGLGDWGPLVVSTVAALMTMTLLGGFLWRHAVMPWLGERPYSALALAALLAPALFFGLNLAPAIFSGLEQPLHILLTIATLVGLAESVNRKSPPAWLLLAILFLPLVRFEGMALAFSALAALFLLGERRKALATLMLMIALLAVYALVMKSLGLPILPSSVLVKSQAASNTLGADLLNVLRSLRNNLYDAFGNRWGLTHLGALGLLGLILLLGFRKLGFRACLPLLAGGLALGAHVALVGFPGARAAWRYNWLWRYDVYAEALALVLLFLAISAVAAKTKLWRWAMLVPALLLLFLALDNWRIAGKIPAAARNIYDQQYQMHRFATDFFPRPVAVNDLGLTSYGNDNYVLDLWGLGSEETRKRLRTPDASPQDTADLAEQHQIVYAMIYDSWLGRLVPANWCKMGFLITKVVTAASPFVSIYLVDRKEEQAFAQALAEFKAQLPQGVALVTGSCDSPVEK